MKFMNLFATVREGSPDDEPLIERAEEDNQPLSKINYLPQWNTVAFLVNIIVTYGVGTLGWLGKGINNAELSEKYQSLVTPNSAAFSIWAVIFLSEGLFTILQWFVSNRFKVQESIQYYFISACLFQAAWTFAFSLEVFWLSLLCMFGIWFSLLRIVVRRQQAQQQPQMNLRLVEDGWWLDFPFEIHFAWITAALALNVNVLVLALGSSAATQLSFAILTLSILFTVFLWSLYGLPKTNYTIALVMVWATWWISVELQSPKPLILKTFSSDIIKGVGHASLAISVIALMMTAGVIAVNIMKVVVHYDEEVVVAASVVPTTTDSNEDTDENP